MLDIKRTQTVTCLHCVTDTFQHEIGHVIARRCIKFKHYETWKAAWQCITAGRDCVRSAGDRGVQPSARCSAVLPTYGNCIYTINNYITIWAVRCSTRATGGTTTVTEVTVCPEKERGWISLAEELDRCCSDSHNAAYYVVFFFIQLQKNQNHVNTPF